MRINCKFYGKIAELNGADEQHYKLDTTEISVAGLKAHLVNQIPGLHHIPLNIAIDNVLVDEGYIISSDCNVDVMPPFAGG